MPTCFSHMRTTRFSDYAHVRIEIFKVWHDTPQSFSDMGVEKIACTCRLTSKSILHADVYFVYFFEL